MRAGYRPERRNHAHEHAARRKGVGEKGEGVITATQPLRHDARPDDAGQEESRPERLGGAAPK